MCSLHFGVNAQKGRVKLKTVKDSLSFALGVESAVGIFQSDAKLEALDKKMLVKGFEENLSGESVSKYEEDLIKFLGANGTEFNQEFLKEGSIGIGAFSAYYFYLQMAEMDQLSNIDLQLVAKGFERGVYRTDSKELNVLDRVRIIEGFGRELKEDFDAKVEGQDSVFWEQILREPGVKQLGETGIYLKTLKEGEGGSPNEFSDIEAHYILTNNVGDTLESSFEQSALKINLQSVIGGWREGFPHMKKGGKYQLYVPYEKAYKNGNIQAPKGALNFYIEFIDFGPKGTITGRR